jgi:hypothetical protein
MRCGPALLGRQSTRRHCLRVWPKSAAFVNLRNLVCKSMAHKSNANARPATAIVFAVLLLPLASEAGSIYLCKAYGGGTFWSQAHCRVHNALIESIVSVPDSLPFDQQVNLAQQQRQPAPAGTTTTVNTVVERSAAESRMSECKNLDARITQLDSMARQPQSGQTQDWIRGERKTARGRQFSLRC